MARKKPRHWTLTPCSFEAYCRQCLWRPHRRRSLRVGLICVVGTISCLVCELCDRGGPGEGLRGYDRCLFRRVIAMVDCSATASGGVPCRCRRWKRTLPLSRCLTDRAPFAHPFSPCCFCAAVKIVSFRTLQLHGVWVSGTKAAKQKCMMT